MAKIGVNMLFMLVPIAACAQWPYLVLFVKTCCLLPFSSKSILQGIQQFTHGSILLAILPSAADTAADLVHPPC
jgi:hypothetical protein